MSSAPQSDSWPPDVSDDVSENSSEANYVSEFLSEKSPEFNAVRQAAASARTVSSPGAVPPATAPARPAGAARQVPWTWLLGIAGLALAVAAVVWVVQAQMNAPASPAAGEQGTVTIISRPAGADVFIEGERQGLTPFRVDLPVGAYNVELRNGSATRSLTITVEAATAVREVIDLAPGSSTGRLEIASDSAGARVSVDGVARGVTPLVLSDVEPGVHRIAITRGDATVYRTVTVEAGATATVMATVVPSGATGGWLTFDAPIDLQVIENGQVLGTTGADRLMLPAGRHELELVSTAHGFRTTATAFVGVGRTQTVTVEVPNGQLSINALPWAEVWLNGESLGSTPLANVEVPVGDHSVVWRHPELGERRQTVRVAADTPARVGVDLTTP